MRKFHFLVFCTCCWFVLFQFAIMLEARGKSITSENNMYESSDSDTDEKDNLDNIEDSVKGSSDSGTKTENTDEAGSSDNQGSGSGESKVFVCPKCAFQSDSEGSCPACNKPLVTPEDNPMARDVPEGRPVDQMKIGKDTYLDIDTEDDD